MSVWFWQAAPPRMLSASCWTKHRWSSLITSRKPIFIGTHPPEPTPLAPLSHTPHTRVLVAHQPLTRFHIDGVFGHTPVGLQGWAAGRSSYVEPAAARGTGFPAGDRCCLNGGWPAYAGGSTPPLQPAGKRCPAQLSGAGPGLAAASVLLQLPQRSAVVGSRRDTNRTSWCLIESQQQPSWATSAKLWKWLTALASSPHRSNSSRETYHNHIITNISIDPLVWRRRHTPGD